VRALEALRRERRERREREGTSMLRAQEADRSGKLVVDAKHVSFARGERTIVRDFSTTIMRGDRVGLIGSNGSGKTTLLRLLLGELEPDSGSVKHGTNLEIAYFDQLREQLDPDKSLFDSIADGMDFVEFGGNRIHVHGYLRQFLFPAERARTPVRALSGGERNRLLLARLFTRSFNLLVLDEPTNDLDIETLDLLEDVLLQFSGTLLLVSHDREFLDNVVTSTLVFEGNGRIGEYAGGYSDWVRQRGDNLPEPSQSVVQRQVAPRQKPPSDQKKRRLTFKENAELAGLPARIDALETERDQLVASMSDATMFRDGATVAAVKSRLTAIEEELVNCLERWEELETIALNS
jgi:ATP-binding cassette subfamily F protein uup